MKTLRHILTWLQATMMLGILSACHDDFQSPEPIPDANIDTGISIRIPNLDATATRATNTWDDPASNKAPIGDEGKINTTMTFDGKSYNDFWLLIYCADDDAETNTNKKGKYAYNKAINISALSSLPTFDDNGSKKWDGAVATMTTDASQTVKVPMNPGTYKVYLVANVHKYLDKVLFTKEAANKYVPIPEDELTDALMTFNSENFGDHILVPGALPMLCRPEDVENGKGSFAVLDDTLTELDCNLAFLCAKVRYTILFDNTTGGHSAAEFGSRLLSFPETGAVTVSNVASKMKLVGTTNMTALSGTFSASISQMEHYPDDPTASLEPGTGTDPAGKLAWQGIVYLPENTSTTSRTKLTFNCDATDANGANASANPYEVDLIKDAKQGSATLLRGHFYDLCIKATTLKQYELDFSIEPWKPKQFLYDLQTPVYLDVENTHITVSAGSETVFDYSTNGEIDYESPKWKNPKTNELIPFYDIKFKNGQVIVTVNSEIPAKELSAINSDDTEKAKYMYFHLISGNIRKKITVEPLNIGPFLMVDPDLITINVREQIGNGQYDGMVGNGAFEIHVRTNLDTYKITAENWTELVGEEGQNTSNILYLVDERYNKVEFGVDREVSNGGETLYLIYDKLNGGEPFWTQDSHELGLNFSVSDSSVPDCFTFIQTYPSTDKYIIHMKCNWMQDSNGNWFAHVYAYQCLEIPGWYSKNNYEYANKPVGYDFSGKVAALEYSYTGKVAFNGWDKAQSLLTGDWDYENNEGFCMIQSLYVDNNTTTSDYYDLNYDFMAEYRTAKKTDGTYRCPCPECRKGNSMKLWPGIAMESEGGNWYRIELPGTAVPGKTLLMFANTHEKGTDNRYPGSLQVGVPLFDYPTREGWIDLTANEATHAFTPNDIQTPDNKPTSGTQTFRIIWHKKYGENICNQIQINSPSNVAGSNLSPRGVMNGDSNLLYYDVRVDIGSTITYQLYKEGSNTPESKIFSVNKNDFTWNKKYKRFELTEFSHL